MGVCLQAMCQANDRQKQLQMKEFTDIERFMKDLLKLVEPDVLETAPAGGGEWTLKPLYTQAFRLFAPNVSLSSPASPERLKAANDPKWRFLDLYQFRNAISHGENPALGASRMGELIADMLVCELRLCYAHANRLGELWAQRQAWNAFDRMGYCRQITDAYDALRRQGFGYLDVHWYADSDPDSTGNTIDGLRRRSREPALKLLGEAGTGKSTALRRHGCDPAGLVRAGLEQSPLAALLLARLLSRRGLLEQDMTGEVAAACARQREAVAPGPAALPLCAALLMLGDRQNAARVLTLCLPPDHPLDEEALAWLRQLRGMLTAESGAALELQFALLALCYATYPLGWNEQLLYRYGLELPTGGRVPPALAELVRRADRDGAYRYLYNLFMLLADLRPADLGLEPDGLTDRAFAMQSGDIFRALLFCRKAFGEGPEAHARWWAALQRRWEDPNPYWQTLRGWFLFYHVSRLIRWEPARAREFMDRWPQLPPPPPGKPYQKTTKVMQSTVTALLFTPGKVVLDYLRWCGPHNPFLFCTEEERPPYSYPDRQLDLEAAFQFQRRQGCTSEELVFLYMNSFARCQMSVHLLGHVLRTDPALRPNAHGTVPVDALFSPYPLRGVLVWRDNLRLVRPVVACCTALLPAPGQARRFVLVFNKLNNGRMNRYRFPCRNSQQNFSAYTDSALFQDCRALWRTIRGLGCDQQELFFVYINTAFKMCVSFSELVRLYAPPEADRVELRQLLCHSQPYWFAGWVAGRVPAQDSPLGQDCLSLHPIEFSSGPANFRDQYLYPVRDPQNVPNRSKTLYLFRLGAYLPRSRCFVLDDLALASDRRRTSPKVVFTEALSQAACTREADEQVRRDLGLPGCVFTRDERASLLTMLLQALCLRAHSAAELEQFLADLGPNNPVPGAGEPWTGNRHHVPLLNELVRLLVQYQNLETSLRIYFSSVLWAVLPLNWLLSAYARAGHSLLLVPGLMESHPLTLVFGPDGVRARGFRVTGWQMDGPVPEAGPVTARVTGCDPEARRLLLRPAEAPRP